MQIVLPVPAAQAASAFGLAPRPAPGAPVPLALVDNGKPGVDVLLGALGDRLVAAGVASSWFIWRKASSGRPMTEEERDRLLAGAGLVVAGVGDCGACTASSLRDAVLCEEAGTPATVVVTEVFGVVAEAAAASLGIGPYHHVRVGHPIWSQPPEWLREEGAAVAGAVAAQLVAPGP